MSQQFDTATVLALEVERTPEPGEVFNRLDNPNGVLGGWGWNTPVPGTLMRGITVGEQRRLRFRAVAGTPNQFTSEPVPMSAGQWAAGRWDALAQTAGYHRGQVEFLNLEGVVIGTSGQTGYLVTGTGTIAATQAPAQTTQVQLRIDVYADATGGQPTGAYDLDLRRAVLATAATEAELGNPVPYLPPAPYTDILGPTHDMRVTREDLNVGTLTATILDADLDPGVDDLIRPGRKTRLRIITDDEENLEPLFTGRILTAQVTYALLSREEKKRARIALTAVDAANPLGGIRRADGVAEIDHLPYVLEGAGVPWNVNGSGNQVQAATVVAVNDNASALDQVAITRDTVRGYAWVDRAGVLQAWDRDLLPATIVDTLDETVYNAGAQIDYDLAGCINAVTVVVTGINETSGSTDQVTYGPFRNEDSIAEFGLQAAEFTVQGIAADDVPAFAQAILDDNAVPVIRIQQVTCPIATLDDLEARATRDLYDLVAVSNERAGITATARISGVEHVITPEKWLLTLTFAGNGAAAPPQSTPLPPPPPVVRPLAPTGLALEATVEIRAGLPYVTLAADWEPVTHNIDDSDLVNLDHYELETKIGAAAGPNAWGPAASTAPDVTAVTVSGYPAGQVISARVRAVNTIGIGGDWSAPVTIGATVDDGVPDTPSTPTVTSRLGTITIRWDGLTAGGLPQDDDFSHVEVHASTVNGFTPAPGDPNTLLDRLYSPGYAVKSVGPNGYNTIWYFRFITVDTSGNASAYSVQNSTEVKPLVDVSNFPDDAMNVLYARTGHFINLTADNFSSNLITADFIELGSLNGELITGLQIQTSADPLTGIKLKNTGIEAYNGGGTRTFYVDASTGYVEILGKLKSGSDISAVNISGNQVTGGTISGARIVSSSEVQTESIDIQLIGGGGTDWSFSGGGIYCYGPGFPVQITSSGSTSFGGNMYNAGSITSPSTIEGNKLSTTSPNTGTAVPNIRINGTGGQLILTDHANSSLRYKENVETLDLTHEQLFGLRPVAYTLKKPPADKPADHVFWGFIAEELQDLGFSTLLEFDEHGRPDEVDYAKITAVLAAASRNLHARVTNLEEHTA